MRHSDLNVEVVDREVATILGGLYLECQCACLHLARATVVALAGVAATTANSCPDSGTPALL